jgi:hypothetical protein
LACRIQTQAGMLGSFGLGVIAPQLCMLSFATPELLLLRSDLTTLHAVENDPHSQVSEIGDLVFGTCADK